TIGPEELKAKKEVSLDVHLMVRDPREYLKRYQSLRVKRVVAQIEPMIEGGQLEYCYQASRAGLIPGLAVDLPTPVSKLEQLALEKTQLVLLLGVKAGLSGQKFDPIVLEKVKRLAALKKEKSLPFLIGMDGGINPSLVSSLVKAGVDELCVTSYLFGSPSFKGALDALYEAVGEAYEEE
ncbi:hypothetical protein MUP65_01255, partial [Patescibacteria group bacterium]|nr:hypothetical protein [Patescibacteria group bacterium]